jgi:hypothetical protein
MNPFREFLANAEATKNLRPRYYAFTTGVGLLGMGLGIWVWYVCFGLIANISEVSLDQHARDSNNAVWMLAWIFLGFPLVLYTAMVAVAGLAVVSMVFSNRLSKQDAVYYALLSRYPPSWFK